MRAIWTFKTLSDQLDAFWLSRESHSEELTDPKQLSRPYTGSPEIQKHVYMLVVYREGLEGIIPLSTLLMFLDLQGA